MKGKLDHVINNMSPFGLMVILVAPNNQLFFEKELEMGLKWLFWLFHKCQITKK